MEKEDRINQLKRHVFYELLAEAGRVMVLVRYSPYVILGKRGFVGDEMDAGITLAFTAGMKFSWDEYGITAQLAFGSSPQKCFIPAGSIAAIYSPELKVQFFCGGSEKASAKQKATGEPGGIAEAGAETGSEGHKSRVDTRNVIDVDFVRKKRIDKPEKE
jgi:hypothetical protein